MRATSLMGVAMAAMLIIACGHDPMNEGRDWMRDAVAGARAENGRHHDAVQAATALPEIPPELVRHEGALDEAMSEMDAAVEMMSHCTGAGMERMTAMMTGMRAAMPAHRLALEAASTLGEAKLEGARHHGVMLDMMDEMTLALPTVACR